MADILARKFKIFGSKTTKWNMRIFYAPNGVLLKMNCCQSIFQMVAAFKMALKVFFFN
jgi:hypothetical protein